VCLTEDS